MTLALSVDIEKLVTAFLRNHADIVALDTRIVGKTPGDKTGGITKSWVRLTKLDSPTVGLPDHLIEYMLQCDCYAAAEGQTLAGQPGAITLARTVRAVLGLLPGVHTDGVVAGVRILGGPRQPDPDLQREREILSALIWAHA